MKLKIDRFSVASPTFFGDTGTTNGNTTKIAIGMDAWAVGTTVYVKPYLYASQASWAQNGSKKTVTIGSFYKETAATNLWPNSTNNFKSSGRSDVYRLYVDYPWIETSYEFSSSQVGRIYVECSFTGNTTASYAPKKGVTLKVSGYITTAVVPSGLTCSVSSYSDTTATLSGGYTNDGGASVTASGFQYKTEGGSWADCSSSLSNLTPNTKYYFRYYATNIAGTAYSAETSITTYDYPKVVSITKSDLKIGESQTVYIYNPTGKAITLYMKKDTVNGTTLYSQSFAANAIKGTNVAYTFTPDTTTLYDSIPSSQSATAYYRISQTGSSYIKSGTYSVVGNENPIFDSSNFTCVTNLSTLTGDTSTIISNKSTITVTITSAGTKKTNGADISKYVATWGNGTPVEITTLNTPTQLTTGSGGTITVSCVDARGLSTPIQVPLEVVNYNAPTAEGRADRQNGVDSNVFVDISGDLFYDTFGDNGVSNAIYSITYRVSTSTTFSGTEHPMNVSRVTYGTGADNKRSWSLNNEQIFSDGQSAGFTIGTRYYVEIKVQDARGLLGTVTLPLVQISDGKIARDVYQDNDGEYHVGFNGLADGDYTATFHGKLNVTDGYYLNGEPFEGGGGGGGDTVPVGLISAYPASTAPHGWLLCDGSAVSRTTYKELFEIIGTSHGSGDGSTTFNLPYMPGNTIVGVDANDSHFNAAGKTYGEKAHTLTLSEIPDQVLSGYCADNKKSWSTGAWGNNSSHAYPTNTIQNSGKTTGNQAHNNMQPSIAEYFMIKAFKVSVPGHDLGDTLPIGSIIDYDGDTVPDGYEEVPYGIITAWPTSNITLSSEYSTKTFGNSIKIGNSLSLTNGYIVIGSGVHHIKLSAMVFFENINVDYVWWFVRKRDTSNNEMDLAGAITNTSHYYFSSSISECVCDVSEGDKLFLRFNKVGSNNPVVRNGQGNTYVTVEVID